MSYHMNEQELIQCPYHPAHMILKHRMAIHLIKCSQRHAVEKYEICPFNATHHVPEPEIQYHCTVCPDRKRIEAQVYVVGGDYEPEDLSRYHVELPPSDENWDEEKNPIGSYLNVKDKIIEKQKVFRIPVGLSKAERKEFFKKEVQRFEKISREKSQEAGTLGSQNETECQSNNSSYRPVHEESDYKIPVSNKGRGKGFP